MKAIILAAGEGKRMKSTLPKALHKVAGKPMLHCVIDSCIKADIKDIVVVVGNAGAEVQKATPYPIHFVWQDQQLGTGHAVLCAKEHIAPDDKVVVIFGDTPLITSEFLKALSAFQEKEQANGVVVAANVPNPEGYGRVFTTKGNVFEAIIEDRDLSADQRSNSLINTGVYMSTGRELLYGLERISDNNSQKEYYLTDVPKIVKEANYKVAVYQETDFTQLLGVNSQRQLADANLTLRNRILDNHLENGVVISDPLTTYIEMDVEIEAEVVLHPGTMLHGSCKIGKDAVIGPYTQITDSIVGDRTTVRQSVLEEAKIGNDCQIGPFAYLRNGAVAGDRCRIGDFVEIKNATLGDDSKASHLAYIGDARIGDNVNFGCGAITVNYDGKVKHLTIVEDGAFIGSNVNLIAPVTVQTGAFVAAGSTIVQDVPADALAIARQHQTNKEGKAEQYRRDKNE
ncbi:MAG: bifunctional UDP-N-acetylglucosamine diphosphorylase/glucosamine-1-phosphate N-acetyltransferase GlmU [Defluviitaleaceae bacterium]|nr:bifunctional UDP-N-acetylglucosamine diphosphorylase/glucosamine-1-phosphate N-acetyltransferase GlmU [Defluviitaleaceae bacterium]